MKASIEIHQIDYNKLVLFCLKHLQGQQSILNSSSPVLKMLASLAHLPPQLLNGVLDAFPQETKDEAVLLLLNKNQQRIVEILNRSLDQQGLGLTISDISFTA